MHLEIIFKKTAIYHHIYLEEFKKNILNFLKTLPMHNFSKEQCNKFSIYNYYLIHEYAHNLVFQRLFEKF